MNEEIIEKTKKMKNSQQISFTLNGKYHFEIIKEFDMIQTFEKEEYIFIISVFTRENGKFRTGCIIVQEKYFYKNCNKVLNELITKITKD